MALLLEPTAIGTGRRMAPLALFENAPCSSIELIAGVELFIHLWSTAELKEGFSMVATKSNKRMKAKEDYC